MMRPVLLAIAIATLPCASATAATTAKVEQGLLQGTMEEGLAVYRRHSVCNSTHGRLAMALTAARDALGRCSPC